MKCRHRTAGFWRGCIQHWFPKCSFLFVNQGEETGAGTRCQDRECLERTKSTSWHVDGRIALLICTRKLRPDLSAKLYTLLTSSWTIIFLRLDHFVYTSHDRSSLSTEISLASYLFIFAIWKRRESSRDEVRVYWAHKSANITRGEGRTTSTHSFTS